MKDDEVGRLRYLWDLEAKNWYKNELLQIQGTVSGKLAKAVFRSCDRQNTKTTNPLYTVFLLAGHETSSESFHHTCQAHPLTYSCYIGTALTFLLHELSCHPDVQNKLRVELKEAYRAADSEGRSSLSAEQLSSLPYLDAVVVSLLRSNVWDQSFRFEADFCFRILYSAKPSEYCRQSLWPLEKP